MGDGEHLFCDLSALLIDMVIYQILKNEFDNICKIYDVADT